MHARAAVFGAIPLASSALNACRRAASALAVTATSRLLAALGPVAGEMVGERYGLKQYWGRTPSTPREYPLGDRRCPTPPAYREIDGVITKVSPWSVADTVARLTRLLVERNIELFAVIDHSGGAERAGLQLRDTKVVIFGNPAAGTPVMVDAPLAALDLPLKVLIWADGPTTRVSYTSPGALAARYGFGLALAQRLAAIEVLTDAVINDQRPS